MARRFGAEPTAAKDYYTGLFVIGTLLVQQIALLSKSTLDLMKTEAFGGRVMKLLEVTADPVNFSY